MIRELEQGRALCEQRAWAEAFDRLTLADRKQALGADDLERLALAAYLVGRDTDYLKTLERAHHLYAGSGEKARAARCAFWLALRLMFRGEAGPASGWFARAERLLENDKHGEIERGYLLLPVVEQQLAAGECEAAYVSAGRAVEIGERFGEADLVAIALHLQGHVRIKQGQVKQGLTHFDEAMVAVTTDELSPLVTGLVYCGVIEGCQRVYALNRAREWTAALSEWCAQQPEMIAFTGLCQVHRSEIMQVHGAWSDAIEAAERARERCQGVNKRATAAALYQQAEVHRLRGEYPSAEEAYRSASQFGWEPQPGLALLRLGQGHTDAAAAAIRRVMSSAMDRSQRARLLPAYVEIMLAAGAVGDARSACSELQQIAATFDSVVLTAIAAQGAGAIELAVGNARNALGSLREASRVWQEVDAPYLLGRVRALLGLCCRALGDEEGSELELQAARTLFKQLGAAPDLSRVETLLRDTPSDSPRRLTARELQVLRLMATGKTNKAIAAKLSLSERTVERHVSNIFAKLEVPSRAAATAYAFEHKLI